MIIVIFIVTSKSQSSPVIVESGTSHKTVAKIKELEEKIKILKQTGNQNN